MCFMDTLVIACFVSEILASIDHKAYLSDLANDLYCDSIYLIF